MTDENKPVASDNVPPDSEAPKSVAPKSIAPENVAPKNVAKARGKSRRLAMQAIYQWQMTGDSITGIKQQFVDENNFSKVDSDYFSELVSGVAGSISELDPYLEKNMSRSVESVDPVERSILRLGVYEFKHRIDVPYRVVLNEAISITKEYCSEKSHTFVNAVLDKVAKEIRHVEVKARSSEKPSSK